MKQIRLLIYIIIALYAATSAYSKSSKKPNIIIILTDDQGYADLGAYGLTDDIRTPHLDKLAKSGALMTHGYSTGAQCIPSRAAIITGKYQNRINVERNEQAPLGTDVVTVAERMQEAGYTTGFVGKWHLEPNRESQAWKKNNWPEGYGNSKPPSHKMRLPYMPINRGFKDVYDGTMYAFFRNYNLEGESITPEREIDKKTFRVDKQTEAALAFIDKNKNDPFFLHLAYFAPHVPMEVVQKYFDRFPGEMAERRRWGLASMAAIDDGVGAIMEKLRQYNLEEDTIIFFFSDNGAPLKIDMKDDPFDVPGWDGSLNGPLVGEKGMVADGGVRVPYFVYWKDKIKPQIFEDPVMTLDAPATALHLAGVNLKKGEVDGVNLIPHLQGKNKEAPHSALFWRFWGQASIRSGKWKFMYLGNDTRMLFDMMSEEGERNNIIEQYPEKAQELESKLVQWTNTLPKKGLPTREDYGREHNWFRHYFGISK